MRKIYVVGPQKDYMNWMEGELVTEMKDADLVVFTGGEDVTPALYGANRHFSTQSNIDRDLYEAEQFTQAKEMGKYIIGICRGSQLACVMNNGILIQNQGNPGQYHDILTYDQKTLNITSTHHQAAFPFNLPDGDYKILGWTTNKCMFHYGGDGIEMKPPVECEVVYYPKTKCLGIQGHPEWMAKDHPTVKYMQQLLNKVMNNEI